MVDLSGPVIRLQNLSREDLYVLLANIRTVFAAGDSGKHLVPDEALTAFMEHCHKRIGDAYFQTPRNTVKAFVQLLSVIEQNPGTDWTSLIDVTAIDTDGPAETGTTEDASQDDELASFKL